MNGSPDHLELAFVLGGEAGEDHVVGGHRHHCAVAQRFEAVRVRVGEDGLRADLRELGGRGGACHRADRLADEIVLTGDVLVVGEHQDRLSSHEVRAGERHDLLACVIDRVGRHDEVHLPVLDERLAVGRDGLDPLDVLLGDAQV